MMRHLIRRLCNMLVNYRGYWRFLALSQRGRFLVGKRAFQVKHAIGHTSTNFRIFLALVRATIPVFLFAALCTGVMLGLVLLGHQVALTYQWPPWTISLLGVVDDDNRSAYDGLLIAIITVTGVFLTLYFTSITTVAGTLYAKVPQRIRSMLIRERVGNVYTFLLIVLTVISMILLIVGTVLDFRPMAAVFLTGFLSLISIQAFAALGERAFRFFDPTSFADNLLWDLGRWSNQTTTAGFRWNDASFQNHYRRQAYEAVKGLKALVKVCHEEDHLRQEPLMLLFSRALVFLSVYLERKRCIPSNSRWYKLAPHHQAWYLSPYHSVDLATKTQAEIQPEMKPSPHWLEEEILSTAVDSLETCLEDGRVEVSAHILEDMTSLFETFGTEWDVEYGTEILLRTSQKVSRFLVQAGSATSRREESTENLVLVERLALLPINLLLGFAKNIADVDHEALLRALSHTNWQRTNAIYGLGLPAVMLERLEIVQQQLRFEIQAEGRVVSPKWYQGQFVLQSMAYALHQQMIRLLDIPYSFYLQEVEQLSKQNRHLCAAVLISNGLQFCNKALAHIPEVEKLAEFLETVRTLKTLPWPIWNWEETINGLEKAQDHLIVHLARSIPGLTMIRKDESIPDYLGKAVHLAGEWCFRSLLANDANLFSEIFPHYFGGALNIREMLREETSGWDIQSAVHILSEPLIDLCELSGYAYLLAEVHQESGLWESCQAVWEAFIQQLDQAIDLLAASISYYRQMFGMTPRSILRTQWKMQIDHLLRSMPRQRSPETHPMAAYSVIPRYRETIDHPSLLVRVMGGTDSNYIPSMYDGLDIFVDLYLRQKPEAKDADFGSHGDLLDSLDRWRRNEDEECGALATNNSDGGE